ncbi:hypothetical protein [Phreatobacter stygius]|uniref:DUF3828 domain-containing protein n=1 Tax=Phreatobacter stygius TaxID=1940610 RepID=A0A4D7AZE3_9HYPH|nr:hypothetical protein [Phreatobacter stygius]QCI63100.1 hypothetical protein E8M01_01925 [Phreatobacter stygius]
MRIVLAVVLAQMLIFAGAARAETPEDIVRGIYAGGGARSSIGRLRAPENRARYFQPALVRLFTSDDASEGVECIGFGLHINGQDFDQAEVARTLRLEQRIDGDKASVDARFTNFGKANHIRYDFVRVGNGWKIADIASFGDARWRLSSIRCSRTGQRLPDHVAAVPQPAAAAQAAPSGATSGATAQAPAQVAQARAEIRRDCGAGARFRPGFQRTADFNGDGRPDYVLDFSAVECPAAASFYCGSAGCTLMIFMSDGEAYRRAYNDNVRGWSIAQDSGRNVLVLDLHGSACGRSGADPCRRRLSWNGSAFTPERPARRSQ